MHVYNSMATEEPGVTSSHDTMTGVLTILPNTEMDLKAPDEDEEGVGAGALLSSQAYLVSPSLSNPTLQSLLASPTALQGAQLGLPEGIQIVTVSNPTDILPQGNDLSAGKVWHIINSDTINQQAIIAVGDVDYKPTTFIAGEGMEEGEPTATGADLVATQPDVSSILMPPPQQLLPPGCPSWAARLKDCEKIGDYYRGYVETEVDLDILLTYHKQATQSFWGTRQSPSPAKQSTRFMWKSQYVPWDGIPFVNTGSRAVVMECQYGPRRKGSLFKKQGDTGSGEYRQTCPARIYIKKVRKFPEYRIDPNIVDMRDKKSLKNAMDKAFHDLKMQNIEKLGQDRFYVQLPLPSAHEFHDDVPGKGSIPTVTQPLVLPENPVIVTPAVEPQEPVGLDKKSRLNPQVVQKIREIVAGGEIRVYHVRRLLRMYVCRYLCNGMVDNVQRHDLTLFPTVTDLKNQIHQAIKDIENGTLALTAPTVNVEPVTSTGGVDGNQAMTELNVWPQNLVNSGPVPETVTVTLTQSPGEDGGHVISRIETHLSDGTTQISTSLTPETAQLLARLNPSMFPPGSLVQLQAAAETGLTEPVTQTQDQSDSAILDDTVKLGTVDTFTGMKMETTVPIDQCERPLMMQTSNTEAVSIATLHHSPTDACTMLTTENQHLAEAGSNLINVSIVPVVQANMEDIQTDSSDEEL